MNKINSVLIAGAGAIGSTVAWQIHKTLPGSVSILAGGERLKRYAKDGFVINGERWDFPLCAVGDSVQPDLIIVACKNHHLPAIIADMRPHVGENTLILSLLNGISSERELGDAFGEWRLPYAMIIGTDSGHSTNQTVFSKTGTIFFGDTVNTKPWSERVSAIKDFFDRSGVSSEVPQDMYNRLWYKYMMNVGINQITAIMRAPYRSIKTRFITDETKKLLDQAMKEVVMVAAAEGVALSDQDIQQIYATVDTLSDEGKTSMCQDVEAGRKTEVELFSLTIRNLAAKHGIEVPVNDVFYALLTGIESSYLT